MRSRSRAGRDAAGALEAWLPWLAAAGLAFWFVIGLPWGPHNESFDWIIRLEQRSLAGALFQPFPSVLSLRPLGTGAAWLLYRWGGHGVALAQVVNALFAMAAWWYAARGIRERRLFAVLGLVAGGVFFAGYIFVFHLHGIFYGPVLLFVAALLRSARGPLDLRALLGVFAGGLVTALVHPYALPLTVAFVLGAALESRVLRTPAGAGAITVVLSGATAAYLLLVPGGSRSLPGDHLNGLVTSFATLEVNRIGSMVAGVLAAWTASRAMPGAAGSMMGVATLALAGAGVMIGAPVLPLWIMWAASHAMRRGHWTLAAVVGACALLPLPNPTGSPTYAVFAVLAAAFATACDDAGGEGQFHALRPAHVAGMLVVLFATAVAVREGVRVPVVAGLARPIFAEGERTRQFEVLVRDYLASPWRTHPARFMHDADSPVAGAPMERAHRPPTNQEHLGSWLDWRRGGPATAADTLLFTFGGEAVPGTDTVLVAHGRYAGDALVLRRIPAAP